MKSSHYILRDLLAHRAGSFPVGFEAKTRAFLKLGNPHGLRTCSKYASGTGFVGAGYVNGIKRTLAKAGLPEDFKGAGLWRGARWNVLHKVIEKGGEFYLSLYWNHLDMHENQVHVRGYYDRLGNLIDPKHVIIKESESKKQARKGLDKPNQIMVRRYKFSSLRTVTINGMTIDMSK